MERVDQRIGPGTYMRRDDGFHCLMVGGTGKDTECFETVESEVGLRLLQKETGLKTSNF